MSENRNAQEAKRVVTEILSFDLERKHRLVEIYTDILHLADDLKQERGLLQELNIEFGDFEKEIKNSTEILLEAECPIIVAGETSAGKSGFINILIGSDILPVLHLACTSTIIKIHNASRENKEIRVTDEKGVVNSIKMPPDADSNTMKSEIKKYVSLKGEFQNHKYVDIFLPVPMLKGNTVIVDTPGIGTTEYPELSARLFEFLPRAVAFIYIIDASHAGGLETDRLLAIFENQQKWKQNGMLIEFDASRTIFVCNKWDTVANEEEEEVWLYIKEKLKKHWPNFKEKQLFKLSVKKEKKLVKKQENSENYKKLLSGIEKLVHNSLEAKAFINARWQNDFLIKTIDRTFGRIRLSRKHQTEKMELKHTVEQRLLTLRGHISKIETDVIKYTEDRYKQLSKDISSHLNNQLTKNRIFYWNKDELSWNTDPLLSYRQVEENKREMIKSRIKKEVELYCQKNEVRLIGSECENLFLKKLKLYDEQSKAVRKLIYTCRVPTFRPQYPIWFDFDLKIFLGTIAISNPLSILAYASFIPLQIATKALYESVEAKLKLSKFNSNPLEFMQNMCDQILFRFFNEEDIYKRFDCDSIQSIREKVKHVCRNILPQQINADDIFIQNVTDDIRSYKEIRKLYNPIGEKATFIMGKFLAMNMDCFSNYSVASANLRNGSRTKKWEGRFAYLHEIQICCEHKWVDAVVKKMKQPLKDKKSFIQLMEVDSLRKIVHPNIVQIFGTSLGCDDQNNKYLIMYLERCSESLENMVLQKGNFVPCGTLQDWKYTESKSRYTRIMSEVLAGLTHLHEEGFVHRDLKLSNILVKGGVSKIADAGLLQLNRNTYAASGTYFPATVAPEVFTDEYCDDSESDIYSIGILMWELYYCRHAYTPVSHREVGSKAEQRKVLEYKLEMKDIAKLIDRVQKGHRPDFETYRPVQELEKLISMCWHTDMSKRPTARRVLIELQKLTES